MFGETSVTCMMQLFICYIIRWAWGWPIIPTNTCGCTDTTLAMSFLWSVYRIVDISLGEDEEFLQQLRLFLPHGGSYALINYCTLLFIITLVPARLDPWGC